MDRYIFERTVQAFVTIYVVVTLSFGLIRLLPGGPMDFIRAQLMKRQQQGEKIDTERLNSLMETYTNIQPQDPLLSQYLDYMSSIFQGQFGKSIWFQEPVATILANALPWTLFINISALLITFTLTIVLGASMAYKEGSSFDYGVSFLSFLSGAIPYYVVAVLSLYIFAYQYNIFPTGGYLPKGVEVGFTFRFVSGLIYHAILPILSLVVTGFSGALTMRANSMSVLGEDYMRVAHLRGLSDRRISLSYLGRNAILPMYTGLMISLGTLFGGSIILEQIFSYPGVGYYMFRAISTRDYPLLMGGFILLTTAVVIGIFIADLTYGKIDPRAQTGGERRESY